MTQPSTPASTGLIRVAQPEEAGMIAGLVAAAFTPLPICEWLAPRLATRGAVLTGYFRLLVTHTMRHGTVHAYGTGQLQAVAGWLPPDAPAMGPDHDEQLAGVTGPWDRRFQELDQALARRHPEGAHCLLLLAVHPREQRRGLGSALLKHHHRRLDRRGEPAVLGAADWPLQDFYRRHGYTTTGTPLRVLDAPPSMWPMRRPPQGLGPRKTHR